MAKINNKDFNDLTSWNAKELRKLKININNRMQSFGEFNKEKSIQKSNPLSNLNEFELKDLLLKIAQAEKNLKFE